MPSHLKCVLSKYCTLWVKMYGERFVKPTIPTMKVNYELMVVIKWLWSYPFGGCEGSSGSCTIPLHVCLWFYEGLESMHTRCTRFVLLSKRIQVSCIFVFLEDFEFSHKSIRMRWHLDMHDFVEHLVFEVHLSTLVDHTSMQHALIMWLTWWHL